MTAKELKEDFIKVWLGDFIESEQKDGIKALNKLLRTVCEEQRKLCQAWISDDRVAESMNDVEMPDL